MLSECSKKVVWRWLLVTSINAQNPEPETTHLYSLPAENAEDGDQGGQEEKTQAGHQHQQHPVILPSSLMQKYSRIIGWGIRFKLQMLCPQEDE